MLSAILDCNVILAGLLSEWFASPSILVLHEFRMGQFELITSPDTLSELREVLGYSKALRAKYSWKDKDLNAFCDNLSRASNSVLQKKVVPHSLTRDVTDGKFLDLALSASADYLVTNDRRHLLRLKTIGKTKIVTPHKFLKALKEFSSRG